MARSADSRPEPGPDTSTSSVRMPCSEAFFTASSAAIWAANGVDFREPLKPIVPEDDQAMVLPCASVMVIMVLLNVAFTWAMPDVMFLRSRRRKRGATAGFAISPSSSFRGYLRLLRHSFLAGDRPSRALAGAGI